MPQGPPQKPRNLGGRVLVAPPVPDDYEAIRQPLDQTSLAVTNPGLAKIVDFLGGLTGFKDALVPDSSNATLAGAALGSGVLGMAAGGLKRVAQPLRAFHGSPHDFDQFSLSKIGTGEGAQAYGHGLYFAENPQVAADYRRSLSAPTKENPKWRLRGEPVAPGTDHYRLASILESSPIKDGESTAQFLARRAKELDDHADFAERVYGADTAEMYRSQASTIKRLKAEELTMHQPGKTYEVAIHASPDEFLDWDKPLSQQSEKVKKTFEQLGVKPVTKSNQWELHKITHDGEIAPSYSEGQWAVVQRDAQGKIEYHTGFGYSSQSEAERIAKLRSGQGPWTRDKGEYLYKDLGAPSSAEAAEKLKKVGIKGIRYADQGSRAVDPPELQGIISQFGSREKALAGMEARLKSNTDPERGKILTGMIEKLRHPLTSNFVVFDDALIEIMKKYGVSLTTAAGIQQAQSQKKSEHR